MNNLKIKFNKIISLIILSALIFLCTSCSANPILTIYFIDVGQGDSIMISAPSGKTALIDAGPKSSSKKLVDFIKSKEITEFEYVISTHPHEDHIGGMLEVLNQFKVRSIIDPAYAHTTKTFENYLTKIDELNIPFKAGRTNDIYMLGTNVSIKILWPDSVEEYVSDTNEISLVLFLTYHEFTLLLTGDIGTKTEKSLISSGNLKNVDVLKIAHHGSKGSTSEAFLKAVNPNISIICVGENNSYNHPADIVLDRLNQVSKIYRTDLNGTIIVKTDGRNLWIETSKK